MVHQNEMLTWWSPGCMLAVEVLVKFLLLLSQKVPPLYLTSFMAF